jgi:hypothetical protein
MERLAIERGQFFLILAVLPNGLRRPWLFHRMRLKETSGNHEHLPRRAGPEDVADLPLELDGTLPVAGTELGRERAEALVADLETDVCDGALGGEQLAGTVHAKAGKEVVRGFTKRGSKESMKVELRETGFACRVLQQDTGLVLGCEKIATAAQTPEGIVMEQVCHRGDDITVAIRCGERDSAM